MTLSAFMRALAQYLPPGYDGHSYRTYRQGRDTIVEVERYGWDLRVTRARGRWGVAWGDARRSDIHIIADIPLEMWHRGARKHVFFWGIE